MQVPRHNVPHYTGSATWDAGKLPVGGAVAALLGDPFQFFTSPEAAAVQKLLAGLEGDELSISMETEWRQDDHYAGALHAGWGLSSFLKVMRGFRRQHLLDSTAWAALPLHARSRLEATWRSRTNGTYMLSAETIACTAATLMEKNWLARSESDVWKEVDPKKGVGRPETAGDLFYPLYGRLTGKGTQNDARMPTCRRTEDSLAPLTRFARLRVSLQTA